MRRWTDERKAKLIRLWKADVHARDIAAELHTSIGNIYSMASALSLGRRSYRGGRLPKTDVPQQPQRRATATAGKRRFTGILSHGARNPLDPWHPASREGSTRYGSMVKPAAAIEQLIKSGANNSKLSGLMEKGRWKGQPIYSLTLEERETCPRSCQEWLTCYGNNLHMSVRISDDGTLTRRLWGELASRNAAHPKGFVMRLHVLGDFFSVEYVDFWRQAIADFPALNIFGFTARLPPDPIGIALYELVGLHLDRCMLRFSGGDLGQMCSEVVDTPDQATGIVCPAELDEDRCCGTCGLCVQSTRKITFLRH